MADDKKHAPHDDLENSGATENVGESSSSVKASTSEHDPYQDNQSTGTKWLDKFLNGIEYLGNKLPEPFTIFLGLFLLTGILSTIFAWQNITFQVPGSDEVQEIHGLFTGEGMTWLTTTMGENYLGFPPLVTVLPILLGVGIAERSGMLSALIRKLFGSARPAVLPYAVGVIGVTGSVMGDAAFVVIPPLAAMVFKAANRHPVAGLLGGFAAVGAGYSTALVPTSLDALFAGISTAVMETLPDFDFQEVTAVSNYFFNIASSIVLGSDCRLTSLTRFWSHACGAKTSRLKKISIRKKPRNAATVTLRAMNSPQSFLPMNPAALSGLSSPLLF